MGNVSAPRRRRKHNFDLNAKRRREIILHACLVDAMDSEDRGRWLVHWAVHNPRARDQVWSLMQTAKRMGGEIIEAEAIAIADEAAAIPWPWKADRLAKHLGVTYAQRQALRLTTIGSVDIKKRDRKELRKRRDRLIKEAKRRAAGMRPQRESLSATKPWEKLGMSRATWYRQNKARMRRETTLSAAYFLSSEDGPVSPAPGAGTSEGGFASKEARERPEAAPQEAAIKARGQPSSQTATKLAADVFGSLPLELRLLALDLPMPERLEIAA